MRRVVSLSLLGLFLTRPLHAAGAWDRYGFDQDDLAFMTQHDPEAAKLLQQGEAELAAGKPQAAADTFDKVLSRVPDSPLSLRRSCEALTALGRRYAAIERCQSSIEKRPTPVGFRALAQAMMSGPPTPQQLAIGMRLGYSAARQMSDQPWGDAIMSYIGERTGDEKMLADSVAELERIAPGHYETRRARAALERLRSSAWQYAAWIAFAAAALGTLCHAAWAAAIRARSRKRAALTVAASLVFCAAVSAHATVAHADPVAAVGEPPLGGLSKWPVDDANPIKSLPTPEQRDRNPLEFGYHMMDLADKADMAARKNDWVSVGKYYEAMSIAVPTRAIGYRKSCDGYEKAGMAAKALQLCRGALGADGTELSDYTHFSKLLLTKPEPLTPAEAQDLTDIVTHLKAQPNTMPAALDIECELAQRLDDVKRLEACVADVQKETPNDPKLVIYQWGIAMKHEDYSKAKQLLDVARQKGLKPEGIDLMARMTSEQSAIGGRILRAVQRHPVAIVAPLALLLAIGGLSWVMRRRPKLQTAT